MCKETLIKKDNMNIGDLIKFSDNWDLWDLQDLLEEYDKYIQDANDENKYKEEWYPVCICEFYDNEYQEILKERKEWIK